MPTLASRQAAGRTTVLVQAASLLAHRIRTTAVEHADGSVRWPTAAGLETTSESLLRQTPAADGFGDLYSGNPGISLFLAAYAHITGDTSYRDLCLRALEPIRSAIPRSGRAEFPANLHALPIGALVGTSSLVYSLLAIGRLLDDAALIVEAHALSSLITPERIDADTHLDLAFGSSGALLVLLALDQEDPSPNLCGHTPFELALRCGRRLAAEYSWPSDAQPKTAIGYRFGLSHGVAGVGLALSRLHRRTRVPEVVRAAHNVLTLLLQLVSIHYSGEAQPDPRDPALASWCHGIPGLCIALTDILESGAAESTTIPLHDAHQKALEWTESARYSPQDHICCGNMGRAAILSYVSRKSADTRLSEAALRIAVLVLQVAKTRGRFLLDYPDLHDASFFRGYSGIAYTCLALAHKNLPHILALE